MFAGRLLSALVVVAVVVVPVGALAQSGSGSGAEVPAVGSGSGSGSAVVPNPAPAKDPVTELPSESTIAKDVATAIRDKDWFLLAGAVLSAVILIARALLAQKWPRWNESHYGVLLAAGFAALASLAVAWVSGGDIASTHTAVGALKLMGAAVLAYVAPKKLLSGLQNTGTASSSDVPIK